MPSIFDLPANILSEIYKMDPTYRDKINKEIFKKSFDIFRKKYINNILLKYPQIVADKLNVLLKFAFEKQFIKYEKGDKPLFTDEITIDTNYEAVGNLYICVGDKINEILFEAHVFTIIKYNNSLDEIINNTNNSKRTRRYTIRRFIENTVFRNDKFVIVECYYEDHYDSDNEGEEEEEDE